MIDIKKSKLLHNTLILLTAMVVTKIVGAIFRIPLANILGGTGMGYYSSAYGLFSPVYAVTAAGIPTAMINLVSANIAKKQFYNAQKIKRVALRLFGFFGLISTLVMLVLAKPFSSIVTKMPESYLPILIISPTVLLCCIGGVYRGYFEGLNNMKPTAAVQIIEACTKAVFGLSFSYGAILWADYQYKSSGMVFGLAADSAEKAVRLAIPFAAGGAVLGVTFSEISAFLYLFIRSKMKDGISKKQLLENPFSQSGIEISKLLIKETAPIGLSAVVMNFMSSIDILTVPRGISNSILKNHEFFIRNYPQAINSSNGLEGLGVFMYGSYTGIAASLFMLIPAIASMLDKSALPNIAAAFSQRDYKELNRNITIVFRGTLIMGFPLCFGLAAMAKPILALLYSSRPSEAQIALPLVQLLGIFGMFLIVTGVIFTVLQSIGRGDVPLKLMLLGICIKWLGNIFLTPIPQINIKGATFSTLFSYIVVFFIGFSILKREVKLDMDFKVIFLRPFLSAVFCVVSAKIIWNVLNVITNSVLSLILSVSAGAIIYILLLIFSKSIGIKSIIIKQK